ncbi:hypothetical protein OG212_03255 [Streptomyces sp. NBC_00391]
MDVDGKARAGGGFAFEGEADLLRYALGRMVVGADEGDESLRLEDVAGVVAAGRRGLGGVAVPLEVGPDVVADLQLGDSFDLLGCQAAVADELPGGAEGDQPEPVPLLPIQTLVPVDPGQASSRVRGRG